MEAQTIEHSLRTKIANYAEDIGNKWQNLKDHIKYIIFSAILITFMFLIVLIILLKQINKQQARINLIEGFLPTSPEINAINTEEIAVNSKVNNDKSETRRRTSSESRELRDTTKRILALSR